MPSGEESPRKKASKKTSRKRKKKQPPPKPWEQRPRQSQLPRREAQVEQCPIAQAPAVQAPPPIPPGRFLNYHTFRTIKRHLGVSSLQSDPTWNMLYHFYLYLNEWKRRKQLEFRTTDVNIEITREERTNLILNDRSIQHREGGNVGGNVAGNVSGNVGGNVTQGRPIRQEGNAANMQPYWIIHPQQDQHPINQHTACPQRGDVIQLPPRSQSMSVLQDPVHPELYSALQYPPRAQSANILHKYPIPQATQPRPQAGNVYRYPHGTYSTHAHPQLGSMLQYTAGGSQVEPQPGPSWASDPQPHNISWPVFQHQAGGSQIEPQPGPSSLASYPQAGAGFMLQHAAGRSQTVTQPGYFQPAIPQQGVQPMWVPTGMLQYPSGIPPMGMLQYPAGGSQTVAQPGPSRANHPQPGDASPYKPQHTPTTPQSPAAYGSYPPTHSTMRYVSPYGAAVPYRESPYTVRSPALVGDRPQSEQPSVGFIRTDSIRSEPLPTQLRPRISLLPATPEYLASASRSRLQQEPYRERDRDREREREQRERERERERDRERERERERECVVVPPPPPPVPPAPPSNQVTGTIQDLGPPIKKIRLGEPKPDLQQPLRIETREQLPSTPAYNPQVEAISPTLPAEAVAEDANFRSTKDDLLQQISKVDREISKTEAQITKLKKKQQELEEAAAQPDIKKEEEESAAAQQPKHQSLAQKIYAENRKKAQKAHGLLEKLGPKVDLPLYNQPSDTAVYHDNKRKHAAFKKRLLEHLKRKHNEREAREKYLTQTYSRLVQEWLRKVEKVENSQKRKAKEAKNREFFEKVFPELRKQREDRERFNRVGARIKSEADLEEIMDGLQEQEMEDKKMRSYAVIPPMLLDARQRRISYVNNNGRIEDFAAEYQDRQLLNVWTKAEIEIFKEKFLQHPKNFGVIASYLDRKSVCDCVQYYYLSKKVENYKRLLRKSRQRTRSSRNPHGKVNNASASASTSSAGADPMDSILSSATGVTTRLQREQLQKQEHPPPPPPPPAPSEPSIPPPTLPASDCDNTSVSAVPSAKDRDSPGDPPILTMAVTPPPTLTCEQPQSANNSSSNNNNNNNNNSMASEVKLDSKKKERRKEEKKKKEEELAETTDEEILDPQSAGTGAGAGLKSCTHTGIPGRHRPRGLDMQWVWPTVMLARHWLRMM